MATILSRLPRNALFAAISSAVRSKTNSCLNSSSSTSPIDIIEPLGALLSNSRSRRFASGDSSGVFTLQVDGSFRHGTNQAGIGIFIDANHPLNLSGPVCGAFKSSDVEYLAIDTGVAYARWYLQQEEQRGRLARAIVLTDCQSAAKSAAIDVDDERIRVQWVRRRFVSGADTYARSASARPALDTGLHFPNLQLYCPS